MEQLNTDLLAERANSTKIENLRALLEKQNKELKTKLAEAEAAARNKSKTTITALEAKVQQLEQQLENEQKEHQNNIKITRRLEKKLKEMMTQVEDERRHATESKDLVCHLVFWPSGPLVLALLLLGPWSHWCGCGSGRAPTGPGPIRAHPLLLRLIPPPNLSLNIS